MRRTRVFGTSDCRFAGKEKEESDCCQDAKEQDDQQWSLHLETEGVNHRDAMKHREETVRKDKLTADGQGWMKSKQLIP